MKTPHLIATTLLALNSAPLLAECDPNLSAEQLIECITIENSGEDYAEWSREHAKIGSGHSREEAVKKDDGDCV